MSAQHVELVAEVAAALPPAIAVDGLVHDHSPTSPRPLADVSQAGVCRRARVQGRARVAIVPTVIFVRHGRSTANTSGTLAGWMPGVFLDETGEAQAAAVGQRLAAAVLPIVEVVSSPLDRCVQTADLLAAPLPDHVRPQHPRGTGGVPLRRVDRATRSRSSPRRSSGRSCRTDRARRASPTRRHTPPSRWCEMQDRALRAVREIDARILETHGKDAVWVAVSHGDVIKSILSHATGAHLDDFQRINVDPASVSVVRYTSRKPFVLRLNDVGGDLTGLRPPEKPARRGGRRRRGRGRRARRKRRIGSSA